VARGSSSSGNKEDMLRCTNCKVKQADRDCKLGTKGDRNNGHDNLKQQTLQKILFVLTHACSSVRKSKIRKKDCKISAFLRRNLPKALSLSARWSKYKVPGQVPAGPDP
jgi:hypothetical protein